MTDRWGSVDGDYNADRIISDRQTQKSVAVWVSLVTGLLMIGCAVWYGTSGEPAALAWLILTAVWTVTGAVSQAIYETHTFVMIAERRTQLIEQRLLELHMRS